MREVVVLGTGQSQFGKFPEQSVAELGRVAVLRALADAGLEARRLQAVYASRFYEPMVTAQNVMMGLGVTRLEMVNVENGCAGGGTAVRGLYKDIAGGHCDVGIAIGVESMTTSPVAGGMLPPSKGDLEGELGLTMPIIFALQAKRLMKTHGATLEDFAQVSVKAHRFGALNPRAQHRRELSVEQVLASRPIADPITLLQCCPQTDGAAAVVLASADFARRFQQAAPVRIAASVLVGGDHEFRRSDITSLELSARAARQAYEMAGLGPTDLHVVEVHDAFACEEIVHYEDLGLCPRGGGVELLRSGATSMGGRIPVNPSGGLLSLGHPLSASGVRGLCDIADQLRGRCGPRQVPGAKVGLTQMLGGYVAGLELGAASVHILTT